MADHDKLINFKIVLDCFSKTVMRQKNKNMEEKKAQCDCEECKKRAHKERQAEEIGMAFLIALMPLMTITLFSNMGLF